jgi:hypothetical protein
MVTSVRDKQQSKGGRPTTDRGQNVGVRLQPPLLAALDGFRADQGPELTRSGAVRLLLAASLEELGHLRPDK